jgi:hypothetical protein
MVASRFYALTPNYDIDPSVSPPRARGTAWAYESYCRQAVLVPMCRRSGQWVRLGRPRPLFTLRAESTAHYKATVEVNFGDELPGTELLAVFFVFQGAFDQPQVSADASPSELAQPESDEVAQLIDALLTGSQPELCGPRAWQP